MLVKFVSAILLSTTFLTLFVYSNYQKQKESKLFLFYVIMCIILYFIIINGLTLLYFYNDIIKKSGPQGEKGYIGEMGLSGERGICDIKCFDKKCSNDFMDAIEYKLNELLSKDEKTKNDPRVIKMREHNILNIEKDDYDKYKKEHYNEQKERTKSHLAVRIIEDIKNIEYNEIAEKIYEELEIKKENKKTTINPDQKLKLEMDIDKLQFDYESYRDLSITDKKLKNNVLNQIVFAICNSKQYNQAINNNLGGKNKEDVNNYVIRVLHELVESIYNSSGDTFDSKIDFFNSEHMKFKDEVLLELMKYDVYHWGLQRIFRPLHIKIDDSIKYNNYLPEDNKPPLKILYTNDYIPIMDDQHYDDKNPKSNKELLTFYRNRNHYRYKEEDYHPVGNVFENKDTEGEDTLYTTDVKLMDYINIFELNKEINDLEQERKTTKIEDQPTIQEEINELKNKYSKMNPTLDKKINSLLNDKMEVNIPKKQTILVTGDIDTPKELTFLQSNEENLNEREDLSIYRPVCNIGYDSIADYTLKGYKKKLSKTEIDNSIKCLPKLCLEDIPENELDTIDTSIGKLKYKKDTVAVNKENKFDSSHHLFRHEKDYDKNPLKRIKKDCIINSRSNPIKQAQSNVGIGWNGRPIRNPKYSIFSYLIEMPQAIISAKTSNYKYYIIHTEIYHKKDIENDGDNSFLTSSRNLYYVLALNHKNKKYDRCLSVDNKGNIIRDKIKDQHQCYWQIIPLDKGFNKIKLMSYKLQNKYLVHNRNIKNYRREVVKNPVYEKLEDENNNDNQIFVNIKSKFGTHIETALDKQSHGNKTLKKETDGIEYYEKTPKQNKSTEYNYYERKIKHT